MEVTALPLGVTVWGSNAHVAPLGNPLQAKLTCWLNPLAGVTVTVVVVDPPALTLPDAGESLMLKDGATVVTVTVTAVDVELEYVESPL